MSGSLPLAETGTPTTRWQSTATQKQPCAAQTPRLPLLNPGPVEGAEDKAGLLWPRHQGQGSQGQAPRLLKGL